MPERFCSGSTRSSGKKVLSSVQAGSGLLVHDLKPPLNEAASALLAIIVGMVPVILAMMLLGTLLPINYRNQYSIEIEGFDPPPDTVLTANTSVRFYVKADHAWGDRATIDIISSHSIGLDDSQKVIDGEMSVDTGAQRFWLKLLNDRPWLREREQIDAMREEFYQIYAAICVLDENAAHEHADLLEVQWRVRRKVDYHQVYELVIFTGALVGLFLLGAAGRRASAKAQATFVEELKTVRQRYADTIEANQELSRSRES